MKRLVFLPLALLFIGCDSIQDIFLEEDLLHKPEAKRCGDCHKNIYNQWKDSRHSKSWVSEEYRKKTENYKKTKCFSCHIPYQVDPLKEPEYRNKHREDGINCVACHFKDETNAIHGEYDVFSPPHPSKQDLSYTKSEICAGCHKKTYQQWKKASVEKQCQNCHMPAKKGSLIQKFPFEYLHLPKEVHDHSFPVPVPDRKSFDIEIVMEKDTVNILITNNKIPHSVPTADNGKPKYYLTVEFIKDGKVVQRETEMITSKNPFEYKVKKDLQFFVFEDFKSLKIILERKLSWERKKKKILEERFNSSTF